MEGKIINRLRVISLILVLFSGCSPQNNLSQRSQTTKISDPVVHVAEEIRGTEDASLSEKTRPENLVAKEDIGYDEDTQEKNHPDKRGQMKTLSEEEKRVILHKGTEAPFFGKFVDTTAKGVYVCRQCEAPLYRSEDKFKSGCGWPSFDDEIKGAVKKSLDADGLRTEITCVRCGGHLGHVFTGEHLTDKNIRHCVNSISMEFIPTEERMTQKIVLAGGCFWGMEELIRKQPGVIDTTVGYTGGSVKNPTYENHEGHAEAVEIVYDPEKTSYKKILDFFFQIHNPTTLHRQGNDIGTSYRSAIFYGNEEEKKEAENFIQIVNKSNRWKGPVVTKLESLQKFYPAEDNHQDYLQKNPGGYTCHLIYFDSYLK